MADQTSIEWTHEPGRIGCTWNPIRGCSRVSPGCEHCYAETMAARFSDKGLWAHGFAKRTKAGPRWTRKVSLIPEKLAEPLSWRKPRRVFVNSMSDLFHESITFEEIAAVVGVIAACPGSIFLSLTKRAKRQRKWFEWALESHGPLFAAGPSVVTDCAFLKTGCDIRSGGEEHPGQWTAAMKKLKATSAPWPLPNWHVGVSAEDQQRWDERVPELLRCPAAVRFVSAEPLLGPIDLGKMCQPCERCLTEAWVSPCHDCAAINQVIVGGESGPGARPCRVEWIRSIVEQCKAAGVKCFTKQFGANVRYMRDAPSELHPESVLEYSLKLKSKKGGDPSEWPAGDWPREMV